MLKVILFGCLFLATMPGANGQAIKCPEQNINYGVVHTSELKDKGVKCISNYGVRGDFSKPFFEGYVSKSLAGNELEFVTATSADGLKKIQIVAECDPASGELKILELFGPNRDGMLTSVENPNCD